jgi:integral membrane protein (TIGR01906 family)
MVDVKIVVRYAALAFLGAMMLLIGIGIWARRGDGWSNFKKALSYGGWLTVGLITALLIYVVVNFNGIFVTFHEIFFASGTWVFRFSDSLIRLFPVVFWRDAFIWVGVIALIAGAALGYFMGRKN